MKLLYSNNTNSFVYKIQFGKGMNTFNHNNSNTNVPFYMLELFSSGHIQMKVLAL